MTYYLRAICIALTLSACLPQDLLIEVAPAPSKIVVASVNIDTIGLAVLVTRSFSALEGNEDSLSEDFINQILVNDAEVRLFVDGSTQQETILEPLCSESGLYFTDELSFANDDLLRLEVLEPASTEIVYAETPVMPSVQLDTAGFYEEINGQDTTQFFY
ncbi:MAG: DUF4249 family protein, partial [Bacteroidota bacterium]